MSVCYNCFTEQQEKTCTKCGYTNGSSAVKYPLALPEGIRLNSRYLVGRVLGQGGFGITYLALDGETGTKAAVKEYFPETLSMRSPGTSLVTLMSGDKLENFSYGKEKFTEEARTLASLSTVRGITQILDYFVENNTSYFVMEYIEGVSFKQYIANKGGRVSPEDALRVLKPVLNALTAVHRLGLIHRDVTPDNIYITKNGEVKLLDFGSAQYSLGEKSQTLDTVLKPGYAPKEQYLRKSRQGPFTDVYSLGACFYASITGKLPPESLERIDADSIRSISASGIRIAPHIDNAIMKALEVNAADRFQQMEDFKAALAGEFSQTAAELSRESAAVDTAAMAAAIEKAAAATFRDVSPQKTTVRSVPRLAAEPRIAAARKKSSPAKVSASPQATAKRKKSHSAKAARKSAVKKKKSRAPLVALFLLAILAVLAAAVYTFWDKIPVIITIEPPISTASAAITATPIPTAEATPDTAEITPKPPETAPPEYFT